MRRKTAIELGVIAVTSVALVFATLSLFPKKTKAPGSAPVAAKEVAKASAPGLGLLNPVIKIRPMKDDTFYVKLSRIADALPLDRDPFAFSGTGPRTSRDGLDLTGILWDERSPSAVIDGMFYRVGDSTDQFMVTAISEDKVLLRDSEGAFELRLQN